jgi:predicted regulator of Ras-like GTPase activity (Roadblock/LC7/MglB family)
MKDMILFPEDIDRLNSVLSPLVNKANLLLAVLINKDGRLLSYQGSLEHIDTQSLGALVAGNSASTIAIANLMGETEFSTMYHQGKDKNIYIAIVDDNTFMALVFDDRTNIDRVKVFARQYDRQLKESLMQVYNKSEDQIDLDLDMGGAALGGAALGEAVQEALQDVPPAQPRNAPQGEYDVYNQPQVQPEHEFGEQPMAKKTRPVDNRNEYIELNSPPPRQQQQQQPQQQDDSPTDTKYLYLQNKIRETTKGKSGKQDEQSH